MTLHADEVLRMTRDVGCIKHSICDNKGSEIDAKYIFNPERIQSFANAIYAKGLADGERREREACAKVCDGEPMLSRETNEIRSHLAHKIRSRADK